MAADADFEEVCPIGPSFASISMPPAPEKEGAKAIGRSRGGLTTKIHALVEALGNLTGRCLTPGQAAERLMMALMRTLD